MKKSPTNPRKDNRVIQRDPIKGTNPRRRQLSPFKSFKGWREGTLPFPPKSPNPALGCPGRFSLDFFQGGLWIRIRIIQIRSLDVV